MGGTFPKGRADGKRCQIWTLENSQVAPSSQYLNLGTWGSGERQGLKVDIYRVGNHQLIVLQFCLPVILSKVRNREREKSWIRPVLGFAQWVITRRADKKKEGSCKRMIVILDCGTQPGKKPSQNIRRWIDIQNSLTISILQMEIFLHF